MYIFLINQRIYISFLLEKNMHYVTKTELLANLDIKQNHHLLQPNALFEHPKQHQSINHGLGGEIVIIKPWFEAGYHPSISIRS